MDIHKKRLWLHQNLISLFMVQQKLQMLCTICLRYVMLKLEYKIILSNTAVK